MSEKVGIFIDGGYMRAAVKYAFSNIDSDYWGEQEQDRPINRHFPESKVDYEKLAIKMAGGRKVAFRAFYTCPPLSEENVPEEQESRDIVRERHIAYKEFSAYLKGIEYEVREGFLRPRKEKRPEQKGVDTFLARDIATLVAKEDIDQICLVTGDGDFWPVVRLAKREDMVFTILWYAKGENCYVNKYLKNECCCTHELNQIEKEIRRW